MPGQLSQHVDVSRHQPVLGDDGDRLVELGQDGQTASGQLQLPLEWLIRVGHSAQTQHPRLPLWRRQRLPQQIRRVLLHEDLRLEIQTGRVAQELVGRPRVAVNTAMFTSSIGIDAHLEPDIRAVVLGDDRARPVGQVLGSWPAQGREIVLVLLHLVELELVMGRLEAVGRVVPRPATSWQRRL